MKIKWLLFGFVVIFLVASVSAEGESLFFEPGQEMDIKVFCFDVNDTFCNTSTTCGISIFYPNLTIYISGESMTHTEDYFNYTATNSSVSGLWSAMVDCNISTSKGYKSFDFYIGKPSTDVQAATISRAVYVLLAIAVALFFGGQFAFKKYSVKWTFFLLSILFFVMVLNLVSISLFDEATNSGVKYVFDKLGAICYWMYWFLGGLIMAIWILTFLSTLADKKRIKEAEQIGQPLDFQKW